MYASFRYAKHPDFFRFLHPDFFFQCMPGVGKRVGGDWENELILDEKEAVNEDRVKKRSASQLITRFVLFFWANSNFLSLERNRKTTKKLN